MPAKNKKPKRNLGQFTNASDLQNRFFAQCEERRKSGEKKGGDANYWDGGCCNWGGSHNLQKDCEKLAEFFNSANSVADDASEIKLSANETIFNQKKQALIEKIKSLNSKCNITQGHSIANICCIWDDYFGIFLKPFLDSFAKRLARQINEVEELNPEHQKELLQLEKEVSQLQSTYDENIKKANESGTSPEDKSKFLLLADEAVKKAKSLKIKISQNPLNDLSKFSNFDVLSALIKGNIPSNVAPDTKNSSKRSNTSNNSPSQTSFNQNQSNNQQQLIIIVVIALSVVLWLLKNQENPNYYERY